MDSDLIIDNDRLDLMNEENCTELGTANDENNAFLITSSIYLTNKVKSMIDN